MRDESVHGQIQRLLDERDQKAFSRLLADSVCSMQPDDFHRVRKKLMRTFTNDQRRDDSDNIWPSQLTANIETAVDVELQSRASVEDFPTTDYITIAPIETTTEEVNEGDNLAAEYQHDDQTQRQYSEVTQTSAAALEAPTGNALSQNSDLIRRRGKSQTTTASQQNRTQPAADLPLPPLPRVDVVQSCGVEKSGNSWSPGDSWLYDVEWQARASVEDFTTTDYIVIAPIETTPDEVNDDDILAAEYRHDDQTQRQYSEVTQTDRTQPAVDLTSPPLPRVDDVRSCGVDKSGDSWSPGDSWPYDVEAQSRASVEEFTTSNYIIIAPIETTDEVNDDDSLAAEYRHDDQTQRQYSEVTDPPLASTTCHHQPV